MTLRGLRTMHTRLRQHEESASVLAHVLDEQATVNRVYYPGLKTHPGHLIAACQQSGFVGMVSFEIDGGESAVRAFVEHLEHFSLAESLGGVKSLVCHPASMTHAPVSDAALAKAGIGQDLIRLSVGLESTEDLVADNLAALEVASKADTLKAVVVA